MLKPPKIVVTNIDEDPAFRKQRKRKKTMEICAVCSILLVNWIMVISKSCFVFGMLSGLITTLITVMQYCLLVRTQFSIHFGPRKSRPQYREHISLMQSVRWTLGRALKCSRRVQTRSPPNRTDDSLSTR